MRKKFRLFRRGNVFYCHDDETGKQESLKTGDRCEAQRLLSVKNQPHEQAFVNLQIARPYLSAADPAIGERTWQDVMDEMLTRLKAKRAPTLERFKAAITDKAFDEIREMKVLETKSQHLEGVLRRGTVSTNV